MSEPVIEITRRDLEESLQRLFTKVPLIDRRPVELRARETVDFILSDRKRLALEELRRMAE